MSAGVLSIDELQQRQARRSALTGAAAVGVASAAGLVVLVRGPLAAAVLLAVVVLAAVPLAAWWRPAATFGTLVGAVLLIEQMPVSPTSDVTDQVPLFTSLSDGFGVSGVYVNPMEVLLLLVGGTWLLAAVEKRSWRLTWTPASTAIAVFLAFVGYGVVLGLVHGGNSKIVLWEARPWVYLAAAYLLARLAVRDHHEVAMLAWLLVIGTGLKGVQGTVRFFEYRDLSPRPEAILSHEESVFFVAFMVLVAALWLYGVRGRLRQVATGLLPFVLVAMVGNNRRTAWLVLIAGLVVLAAAAWRSQPHRRRALAWVVAGALAFSAVYVPLTWHSTSVIAQPTRAFRSAIAPDPRDSQSNLYRMLEDANLGLEIRASTPLGVGFGIPIQYRIPMVDLSNISSLIRYVPHNGILYVWMRLGLAGILAFWALVGAAAVSLGRLIRSRDRLVAVLAVTMLATVLGWVIQGYFDMGLFWFRLAMVVGFFLGTADSLRNPGRQAEAGR